MIGWMRGRQREANFYVAKQMIQHARSDYPGHTAYSLAYELNEKMGLNK